MFISGELISIYQTLCANEPTARKIVCDHGADLLCEDQSDRPSLLLIMASFDVLPLRAISVSTVVFGDSDRPRVDGAAKPFRGRTQNEHSICGDD